MIRRNKIANVDYVVTEMKHQSHNKRKQLIGTGVQGGAWLGGQGDPQGNVQQIQIWSCQQMVYSQPSTCLRKWHTQTPMGLWYTKGSPNLGQKTRPYNNQQQKKPCKIVDFAVPADYRIKLKECEKRDKNLDLARELKKIWNMKVTIIPIVTGAFGTVTKGLLKGMEDLEVCGRVETI